MTVSIETIVGLSLHVLSDYFGGIAGVHYKGNILLILVHYFVGAACAYSILHNIIVIHAARPVCSCMAWVLCFEILF